MASSHHGRPAHVPFGAYVRAGAENDPQALFLAHFHEFGHVGEVLPVDLVGMRLDLVPEQVDADRVESHCFGHLEPVAPVFAGNAVEVQFSAAQDSLFAVDQETGFRDLEGVPGTVCASGPAQKQQACQ